jgi:cephalosporin hydroxylase
MQLKEKAMRTEEQINTINRFHDLYYNGLNAGDFIYDHTYWMNVPCLKCPLDLWIYQEIIVEQKPDLIIETGTHKGGSALYLAHLLDLIGQGEIVTIDILGDPARPVHPRISYVQGSSADEALIQQILSEHPQSNRLVILDSDHSKTHVLAELQLLAPLVPIGGYVIVEDTNINGHPTFPTFGEGPYEAVQEFLSHHPNFIIDESREKFLMTFNPQGYLKRMS